MNRFERILGILMYLRSGQSVSANQLAARFEVSRRTIYRDIETLSALGVPVYAERGREGGFQLLDGYFLPPLMFSTKEAVSLLLGLTFLHTLEAKPFAADLETAEQKLLTAMPDRLRTTLKDARQIIGFEKITSDAFHPEPVAPSAKINMLDYPADDLQNQVVTLFLQAILDEKAVRLKYNSPYRDQPETFKAQPLGLFWDRNRWYLVGYLPDRVGQETTKKNSTNVLRFWRTDRVITIKSSNFSPTPRPAFDIQSLLGHQWLETAMASWRQEAPVKIRITSAQAQRLQQDWYYRHAHFEPSGEDHLLLTFGEDNGAVVLELLRWLGPGAELIEPTEWRSQIRDELQQMLEFYKYE